MYIDIFVNDIYVFRYNIYIYIYNICNIYIYMYIYMYQSKMLRKLCYENVSSIS